MYHNCLIQSYFVGYLAYFHGLAIVSRAAVNMKVQVSFQINVFNFLDRCLGVELLDQMEDLWLMFWDTSILLSLRAGLVCIPLSSVGGFPFLHILPAFVLIGAILIGMIWYLIVVCISLIRDCEFFLVPAGHFMFSLEKYMFSSFVHFFVELFVLLL